jgi:hypothetical protein
MENNNDYLENSLALLAKYLKETPSEVLNKHIEEVDSMKFEGVTVEKYFKDFDKHFKRFNNFYDSEVSFKTVKISVNSGQFTATLATHLSDGKVVSSEEVSFTGNSNYQYAMAA